MEGTAMALLEVPRMDPPAHFPAEEPSEPSRRRTRRTSALSERALSAVRRTVQFVEEHYGESVLLTNLARELGISVFALSRAFKRIMRVSATFCCRFASGLAGIYNSGRGRSQPRGNHQ
jgi:AraC-like DNA-binding protein